MPTFTIEQLPDEPVVVFTVLEGYDVNRDLNESNPATYALLDALAEPMDYILDVDRAAFTLEDIMRIASTTSRSGTSTFHHPNVLGVIVVTHNPMIAAAVKGLNTEVYGYVKAVSVSSLDEALHVVRLRRAG